MTVDVTFYNSTCFYMLFWLTSQNDRDKRMRKNWTLNKEWRISIQIIKMLSIKL